MLTKRMVTAILLHRCVGWSIQVAYVAYKLTELWFFLTLLPVQTEALE